MLAEPGRLLKQCPSNWSDIRREYHHAVASDRSLVLAYRPDELTDVDQIWQQIVGIAKFLSRTQKQVSKNQLQAKLSIQISKQFISIFIQSRNNQSRNTNLY